MPVVHCPGCNIGLNVPEDATGRPARCPACKTKFRIPSPQDLMEDTVCAWLASERLLEEEDVSGMGRAAAANQAGATGKASGHTSVAAAPATHTKLEKKPQYIRPVGARLMPAPAVEDQVSGEPPRAVATPISGASEARAATKPMAPPPPPTGIDTAEDSGSKESGAENVAGTMMGVPGVPEPLRSRSADIVAAMFPAELVPTGPRPHLVVRDINQAGVRLAFDSIWLESLAFRCALPVRGVFSGNTNREELRARPLAFIDRSGAVIRSPAEFEARYEQQLYPQWSTRDIINAMGLLEGLPRPFCYPMPYYVDNAHKNLSLACSTFKRPDGGITCEVLIPSGRYALDWLRHINGVCGTEYEALEREVALIDSDQWARLAENVRQRVGVWCKFQPRERFILYLSDADFGVRDAGLAGIIITDRRIIFHKFHHSGQIDLNEPGTLSVKQQDDFLALAYESWQMPGHRTRLVKLHEVELPLLIDALGQPTGLRIVVG